MTQGSGQEIVFIMHHNDRKSQIVSTDETISGTPARLEYVRNFIKSQGYLADHLKEDQLMEIFILLARIHEYSTHHKHNNHNWETIFAPIETQRRALEPLVDQYIREWAQSGLVQPNPHAPPTWPAGKKFALCLTHDVDIISGISWKERLRGIPYYIEAGSKDRIIYALSTIRELARSMYPLNPRQDPPIDIWMTEEAKHGFRSTFFFLASPLPAPHWEDSFYRYGDKIVFQGQKTKISLVMKQLIEGGWDIGLHGASRSSYTPAILSQEKKILDAVIGCQAVTIRQHRLNFDIRYTPFYQTQAGFQADSTLGSNVNIAFRCGTCYPFFIYDLFSDTPLNLLEVPLIVQDVALFRRMGLDEHLAVEQCRAVMEQVANVNGVMTILWHNNHYPDSVEFKAYCKLLDIADKMGAWGCSLKAVNSWWRERCRSLTV